MKKQKKIHFDSNEEKKNDEQSLYRGPFVFEIHMI